MTTFILTALTALTTLPAICHETERIASIQAKP
jgi:hypothetical protein